MGRRGARQIGSKKSKLIPTPPPILWCRVEIVPHPHRTTFVRWGKLRGAKRAGADQAG